jgi:RimJ/RimL family protein N-acetyltransferase
MPAVTDSFPTPTELRTARLLLRPPRADDLDAYVALTDDPEYSYFGTRQTMDREATAQALARIIAAPWQRRAEFAIVMDGHVVGRVMLDVDRENRTAALGYGVAREHWGHGVASEAARATLDYAFEAFGVDKVWARADPRNGASVRVLEKLGMQREGLLRRHIIRYGERTDRVYYGLLREEWEAARQSDVPESR